MKGIPHVFIVTAVTMAALSVLDLCVVQTSGALPNIPTTTSAKVKSTQTSTTGTTTPKLTSAVPITSTQASTKRPTTEKSTTVRLTTSNTHATQNSADQKDKKETTTNKTADRRVDLVHWLIVAAMVVWKICEEY